MNKEVVNTRTGVGAGIGALIGFAFAGPMGAGVGALIGGGVAHASDNPQKGVMTARRALIYKTAMETIKDPIELNKLAVAFASEGLSGEASMLRKRANLRGLPPDTQEKRRAFFRKAMASDNPDLIVKVAAEFEAAGSIDAGKTLRAHAEAVRAAHAAGKSAKPMAGGSQAQFADKLAKALIHFGPDSGQAKQAAANLIRARGKAPSEALVGEVIRVAANALKLTAPEASPPAEPIQIAAVPSEAEPEEGATDEGMGAVEAPAIGNAPGDIEAPVITHDTDPAASAIEPSSQVPAAAAPVGPVTTVIPTPVTTDATAQVVG